jgi:uncharacterized protein YjlB
MAAREGSQSAEPTAHFVADDGVFPNSRRPALVYRAALEPKKPDLASRFERRFAANGWTGAWRNGLYTVHHYHSTAHEVLGVYSGHVAVRLGGPDGVLLTLTAGDVVVIPAGLAHKNESESADFHVVGAYPAGTSPDMQYGKPGERPASDERIARLPLPSADPMLGERRGLCELWRAGA